MTPATRTRRDRSKASDSPPKTIVDCSAWNRTNLLSARSAGSTTPVTQPTHRPGPPPRWRRSPARRAESFPSSMLNLRSPAPRFAVRLEHRPRLVVEQHPERVDAERRAERQHEQVGHGEPQRRETRPAGWRRQRVARPTRSPPRREQQHRADQRTRRGDTGGDSSPSVVQPIAAAPSREHQRRHAEQHADRAPDELQDPEMEMSTVEMRHDTRREPPDQRMLMRTSTTVGRARRAA